MSNFEVIVLGVGDAFSEKYHSSALLLVCEGFFLAIDCPDRYRKTLRRTSELIGRKISLSDINYVLITHLHGDHVNGLEGIAFYNFALQRSKIKLISSPEVRSSIWDERLKTSMGTLWTGQEFRRMEFENYFDYVSLSWENPITVGPFRLWARRTLHHVHTSALFIEAAGRMLGYSSDTAFDPRLIEFLEPADLIIHETNLGPAHTSYSSLAALPAELRTRMRLIHYPDTFDTASSAITALKEGEVIRLMKKGDETCRYQL